MDEISATIKQLRLPGMEQCWRSLIETRRIDGMSLRDGLLLLLQAENEQRNENRNERLLKRARFRYQATIMETQFDISRGLDKNRVMELMEDRHGMKSTIIVSQLPVANWYDMMKVNSTAADAILDRIVHTAQRFELKGDSLRKK